MRYLLIFAILLIVTCASCSKSSKHIEAAPIETADDTIPQDESFEDFIVRFHHDSVFQSSRLAKVITGYNSDEDPIYNSGIAPGVGERRDTVTGEYVIDYNGVEIMRNAKSLEPITEELLDSILKNCDIPDDNTEEYIWQDSTLAWALHWADGMFISPDYDSKITYKSETEIEEDLYLPGSGFSFSLTFIKNDNEWILEKIFYNNF